MAKPYGDQKPKIIGKNRGESQHGSQYSSHRQLNAGRDVIKQPGGNASYHHSAPVESCQKGGNPQVHATYDEMVFPEKRQTVSRFFKFHGKKVYIGAHRHLCTYIKEDSNHS